MLLNRCQLQDAVSTYGGNIDGKTSS